MKIPYTFLNIMIDSYIDQEGITKATADILTVLTCKLNDKVKQIEPQLKEGETEG